MRFVLVHGGMHAAWCWSLVAPVLQERGHVVVAPDLPGHGDRHHEPATLDGYVDAVTEVVAPGDVVVGHSLGGTVVTVVADRIADPIGHLVFIAAAIPAGDGSSVLGARRSTGAPSTLVESLVDGQRCLDVPGPAVAREYLFHDADDATAAWAIDRLRPQPIGPLEQPIELAEGWWNRHPRRSYVVCDADRTIDVARARSNAARVGATVTSLPSSHSPFLSMPERLADSLEQLAR